MLRATAAYDFSTSAVQKAVRDCGVLCILTAKCASRHSRVPFFRMRSGNIGPGMRFFVQFDLYAGLEGKACTLLLAVKEVEIAIILSAGLMEIRAITFSCSISNMFSLKLTDSKQQGKALRMSLHWIPGC